MQIVLATNNAHKKQEIEHIFSNFDIQLKILKDFPGMPEVIEDEYTFRENAIKKATEVSNFTGKIALADDSGLVVEALDGMPGIFSARFAGKKCSYEDNNKKLLSLLKDYPLDKQRKAKFICVMALAFKNKILYITRGECKGIIAHQLSGKNGFGYDPIFYLPKYKKTFAEIEAGLKNKISHRAQALKGIVKFLQSNNINSLNIN